MDEEIVFRNCHTAQDNNTEIDDATARVIGSWYHHDRYPSTLVFTSTGAIPNGDWEQLWMDFTWGSELYDRASDDKKLALDMLGAYLANRKDYGPVPGWSELWVK